MDQLSLFDRSRAIRVYERSRGINEDGQVVTSLKYYEEQSSIRDPFSTELDIHTRTTRPQVNNSATGNVPTVVYANSVALLVLILVTILHAIAG